MKYHVYDRLSIVEYEMFAFMTLNSSSISQPAFTCSQWTMEAPEQCFKYVHNKELTIKTPKWRQWRRSAVFIIINFEQISNIVVVFPLLTLNK